MNFDVQRELIPRNTTLHLLDTLDAMKTKLMAAAEQSQLLDETGHVPSAPSYADLLQHAVGAQALSRDVLQLTADFARSTYSTNRAGSAVLAHLATAAAMSTHAAPYFAETAESALALPRTSSEAAQEHLGNRMVIDHATARAYLRRASESLRNASNELDAHLDFHRFFPASARQQNPAAPPTRPNTRRH
ncbi:hypothetical protein ACGFW5_01485 [Streptomyces sp. NPDC048416]|uniref:hypothetical protein n=1 Tax=Streptomyces sp. NPDC048416 TaxID=3365546 RepID=UPI00371DFB57